MQLIYIKMCPVCGISFETHFKKVLCCSHKHAKQYYKETRLNSEIIKLAEKYMDKVQGMLKQTVKIYDCKHYSQEFLLNLIPKKEVL